MRNELTEPLICTCCGNKTVMQIAVEYNQVCEIDDIGSYWQILECLSCKEILLSKGFWDGTDEPDMGYAVSYEIVYPNVSEKIHGLPKNISKAYEAAQKVKRIDSNAFAVLLGRVLDFVCLDKEAEGKHLYNKLEDLANKGIIPQQLGEMAQQLRNFRNIGAHADFGELTKEEVPILEALIKAILEYVYSAPNLIQTVQLKIDEFKALKKK